jgi:FAD/FMN-containing dehydrogenase
MGISRRSFLSMAGLGAAGAVLAGCTTTSRPTAVSTTTTGPPTTTAPPSTSTAPRPMDYQALARSLSGSLVLPGDSGYDAAKLSYNPLYDARKPAAVALCGSESDVQHCVTAAVQSRTAFAARSGGHSYAGYSTPDGALVIDVGKLSSVQVNADGTATVGAGTRLIDVYSGLAGSGRALPAGSCPSVGVAGLTLGGGVGVLARKYGLTCDNLTGASVVTADGTVHRVDAGTDPDLFWALRGGGGGNFGVVTSFTFKTAPAPQLTVFSLSFPSGSAAAVFGGWQDWIAGAPDELWSTTTISGTSSPSITVGGCYVGSTAGLDPLLDSLVAKTGSRPTHRSVAAKSCLDAMRYFAGCSSRSVTACHLTSDGGTLGRESFQASSRVLDGPVSDPAKLVDACAGHSGLALIIDSLGGAVGQLAPTATAFPHRTALATAQIYFDSSASAQAATAKEVGEVRDGLADVIGTGGYVNYIDPAMPDWATAYYGDNLPKLQQVAKTYDPSGAFTFAQSITKA